MAKEYPRYYQIVNSSNQIVNSTNAEVTARKMLKHLQTMDKNARIVVYDRRGVITDDKPFRTKESY